MGRRPGTLSLAPIELPDDAQAFPPYLASARALVADFEASFTSSPTSGWRGGKAAGGGAGAVHVKTAKGRAMGPGVRDMLEADETWIGRKSTHGPEHSWEKWQNLLKDHEGHNSEWIPELRGLEVLVPYNIPTGLSHELHSAAAVWISRLALPMPLQDRTFLVLVLTTSTETEFINISIPFTDTSYPPGQGEEQGRTRGSYVSVERVRRLPCGKTEWIVLTSFSLGGNVIPQLAVNVKMASKLVDDVDHYLQWMRRQGRECASGTSDQEGVACAAR